MLLALFNYLSRDIHAFAVFNYLTLRAVLAMVTALVIGLAAGPAVIRHLTRLKFNQAVRDDGPKSHYAKSGTPTMGGLLVLLSIELTTVLWADLSNRFIWLILVVTAGFGLIGWVDDYRKVVYRNPKGMSSREKFFWQSLLGFVAAVYLTFAISASSTETFFELVKTSFTHLTMFDLPVRSYLMVPFFKNIAYPMGAIGFTILSFLVIVGTSNAVNLTDGLDGLAIMPTVMVGAALGIFSYVVGRVDFAHYLIFPYVPGAAEMIVYCGALGGAGLAFLWFNANPAQVFMGDVGALALGAALGTVAIVARQEITLFIMGGIFVVETLSVILQVGWFKYTKGKRIFRMAPLHHHFELSGWKETQVVVRFWIISMLLVLIGLATLKIR